MRIPVLLSTALVITSGVLGIACSGSEPTESTMEGDISQLRAHTPLHEHSSASQAQIPDPASSYTGVDAGAARGTDGSLHLEVDATGAIPRFPDQFINSVAVFGYAWVDLDAGKGIVAVIHPAIGRDSRQNPDGWHTHPVELGAGTKPAGSSDFCVVSIGRSQGGISIHEDVLQVQMAERWSGISAGGLDVAASFIVQADAACTSGLGVAVIDTAGL